MEDDGSHVNVHNLSNLLPYKQKAKLGNGLGSCHTTFVDGYAIEGHVPANDVKTLLQQKLDILGLTVPAMSKGTPGIETPDHSADSYQVISFKEGEEISIFSQY